MLNRVDTTNYVCPSRLWSAGARQAKNVFFVRRMEDANPERPTKLEQGWGLTTLELYTDCWGTLGDNVTVY